MAWLPHMEMSAMSSLNIIRYLAPYVQVKAMLVSHSQSEECHQYQREKCVESKYETVAVVVHCIGQLHTAQGKNDDVYESSV